MRTILFEDVFSKENIDCVLDSLNHKKDGAGVDGIFLSELPDYWKINGDNILSQLEKSIYNPGPVRMVEIVGTTKRRRDIAIYNSVDRLILGCLAKAFKDFLDSELNSNSYAFREGKGVTEAVKMATEYLSTGNKSVVKVDISGFFDNISLTVLNDIIRPYVSSRLFRVLQKYMNPEIELDGDFYIKDIGIVQGSPISTFLSNIYLNNLDNELEKREVQFCRYSDDYILFFKNIEKAKEVYTWLKNELNDVYKLSLNAKKTIISDDFSDKYLGYYFRFEKNGQVTAYKRPRKNAVIYGNWHKSIIKRVDRNYHLINDGIIGRKDFNILFEGEDGKKYIPVETSSSINIYSNVMLTSSFLDFISRRNLDINIFDKYGNMLGYFASVNNGFRTKTMLSQAGIYMDEGKRLQIAKALEIGSMHNLRANLKYYYKKNKSEILGASIAQMSEKMIELNECSDTKKLLLIEARARTIYYGALNEIISNREFEYTKRTKRPPQDPLNALISFGNMFMHNRIATEINKTSLDIRIGFIHSANRRNQSLNLDIAEIFKPIIVDRVIFSMINRKMIHSKQHFETAENGGVYLNNEGKRLFINELYYKLGQVVKYKEKELSYGARIREEINKIYRYVVYDEKYKPYKYQ